MADTVLPLSGMACAMCPDGSVLDKGNYSTFDTRLHITEGE
jgi:hypothetical protein